MAVFGYIRVSTAEQNEARQIEALKAAGVEDKYLFIDKISGVKASRPALDDMLGKLREGDTVAVVSFDRLARSTKQLLSLAEQFEDMGVNLVSLHEQIDTRSAQGKLFFTISAAFAEFERSIIKQRQAEGYEAAKAAGRKMGRKPMDGKKVDTAMKLYATGEYTVKEACEVAGISESVFYRAKRVK